MEARSLRPCHRLDRCASGLTLLCPDPGTANLVQGRMEGSGGSGGGGTGGGGGGGGGGSVSKLYVARVGGKFPRDDEDACDKGSNDLSFGENVDAKSWGWMKDEGGEEKGGSSGSGRFVEVNVPVETIDAANGVRAVSTAATTTTSGSTGERSGRGRRQSRSRFRSLAYDPESGRERWAAGGGAEDRS